MLLIFRLFLFFCKKFTLCLLSVEHVHLKRFLIQVKLRLRLLFKKIYKSTNRDIESDIDRDIKSDKSR